MVKIHDLVIVKHLTIERSTIIFLSEKERNELCRTPYPGHKKGCPNYNDSENCSPKAYMRTDILTEYNHFILVYAKFDFETYQECMNILHEHWTPRQLRNVLYWQGQLKKIIKDYIEKLVWTLGYPYEEMFGAGSGFWDYPSMEAVGMLVLDKTEKDGTVKRGILSLNNIPFEIYPEKEVTMCALLLFKK